MLSVTSEIASSQAPTSNRFLNKKAIILAAGALFLCISGVTIAVVFSNSSESTSDSGRIVTDAQNQVASIKDSNSLASDATDTPGVKLAAFDKIKHHVVTNPVRTAAIVFAVVAVLIGIIVTAVLLSTSGKEIESVIPPDPADSETENGTEGHQTDDPTTIEETGLSEPAKIGIGVGAAAVLLLILGVVLYFKRTTLKTRFCGGDVVTTEGGSGDVTEPENGPRGGASSTNSDRGSDTVNQVTVSTGNNGNPNPNDPNTLGHGNRSESSDAGKHNAALYPDYKLRLVQDLDHELGKIKFTYVRLRDEQELMVFTFVNSRFKGSFQFLPDPYDQDDSLHQDFKINRGYTNNGTPHYAVLRSSLRNMILELYTGPELGRLQKSDTKFKVKFEFDEAGRVKKMTVKEIKSR